jgi:CubicO group peptidase (beta-lactamase class C family)
MRRVLTILAAVVLLIVSLGIGVFTADLPFWQRALQLPLAAGEIYLPRARLGENSVPIPRATAEPAVADAAALELAVARARESGSRALLAMQRGQIVLERHLGAADADWRLPATLIARPVAAMAVGIALAERRIESLDTPLSGLLNEWQDDPRGRITLRQLLEETSGLETGGAIRGLLQRSPWQDPGRLPQFATSRGVRMLLGNDFTSSALGFRLEHEPGGFYNQSPANTQLVAVILERATGQPYETFVDESLWLPLRAAEAEMQMDRRSGMPAAHCCWRARAEDMLRVAALLADDGKLDGRQVLPAGWVSEMSRPTRVNAETGLQLRRLQVEGQDALAASDDQGSAFWVIPARQLVVLSVAGRGEQAPDDIAALVMRALESPTGAN